MQSINQPEEWLICPETKQSLVFADAVCIERANRLIDQQALRNRDGRPVFQKLCGGLISRTHPLYLYPIRMDIPTMLIGESIPLDQLMSDSL